MLWHNIMPPSPLPLMKPCTGYSDLRSCHSYVPCKSVCDQDQNWIKQSKPFLKTSQGIMVTSKLRKSKGQECMVAIQKGTNKWSFCPSKILIPVTNVSTGDIWHISDYLRPSNSPAFLGWHPDFARFTRSPAQDSQSPASGYRHYECCAKRRSFPLIQSATR